MSGVKTGCVFPRAEADRFAVCFVKFLDDRFNMKGIKWRLEENPVNGVGVFVVFDNDDDCMKPMLDCYEAGWEHGWAIKERLYRV